MEDQNKYNGRRHQDSSRQDARRYADESGYAAQDGQQYAADPRYAQYTDPRYAQQDSYTQEYGGYAQQYTADPRYTQQYPDPRYAAGQTGRIRVPREGYGQQSYAASGRTERIRVPREGYEQGYAASGRTERIRVPREGYEEGYAASGRTERIRVPREGYEDAYAASGRTGRTERIRVTREGYEEQERAYARGETGRIRRRYEEEEPIGEELYEEDFMEGFSEDEFIDEEGNEEDRSAFARRLDAIRYAIAEIPARKLLMIGGGIALMLVAIILLVVLLPGKDSEGPASVAATPTPEWTATPVPTRAPTPTPAPTAHPLETPLQFGMEADIVADIQLRLIELGYMDYPVVDGVEQVTTVYGRTTKGAIQTFQEKNGLDSDGWCGKSTYDLLMSDTCKAYFISRNDEGDMVLKMQNRLIQLGYLKAAATGYCGESTVLAVQKFQQSNGLDPDGKAGQQTLTLLYSDDAVDINGVKMPMTSASTATADTAATTDTTVTTDPAATADPAATPAA